MVYNSNFNTEIGFDFGNSHAKATDGQTDVIFKTGFIAHASSSGLEEEMYYDGKYYTFGKRSAVEARKTESERMRICTLYAAAKILEASGVNPATTHIVDLGTDIPISQFGDEKNLYRDYYQDNKLHYVTLNGTTWRITFGTCMVFPQGLVAQTACGPDAFGSNSDYVLLDIGGRTIDIAVVHVDRFTKRPSVPNKVSLQYGVLTLFDTIDGILQARGIQISEDMIEAAIYGDTLSHQKSAEIKAVANEEADKYVADLVHRMYEAGIDTNLAVALLSGGGDMLKSRLENTLNIILSTGIMGNARGCLKSLKAKKRSIR